MGGRGGDIIGSSPGRRNRTEIEGRGTSALRRATEGGGKGGEAIG